MPRIVVEYGVVFMLALLAVTNQDNFSPEDEELWNDFLSGDRDAISELFLRYYENLYRYGLKINPCKETVKDSIQELFLRLWKKRQILSAVDSVKSYLIISLRRILLRQLDTYDAWDRRNREYSSEITPSTSAVDELIVESEMQREQKSFVEKSLELLTEKQREVLFLKFYEGYTNSEISEMIDVTYQRVCNITHEALLRLRKVTG